MNQPILNAVIIVDCVLKYLFFIFRRKRDVHLRIHRELFNYPYEMGKNYL